MTSEAYVGERRRGQLIVTRMPEGTRLTPERSLELATHSPSGFESGYCGSGPAQLLLALLLDYPTMRRSHSRSTCPSRPRWLGQLECTEPDGCWRLTWCEIDAALRETVDEPVAPSVHQQSESNPCQNQPRSPVRTQNRPRTVSRLSEAVFLVGRYGYQTALSRLGLSGRPDVVDRPRPKSSFTLFRYESTASIIRG